MDSSGRPATTDDNSEPAFVPPRPWRTSGRPRLNQNSALVVGKSHSGPGATLNRPATTDELTAFAARRGTTFAPFAVQMGQPRPRGVIWDVPWDKTTRNITGVSLWRRQGAPADTTPLPTDKQGWRTREDKVFGKGVSGVDSCPGAVCTLRT